MLDFVQNLIDGLMIGSSYGLLALGFTLTFGAMRRLNLSYGPSIMVGVFAGTLVHLQYSAGLIAVAAATMVGAAIATVYVERLCFAAIRSGAAVASMVSSFAVWMQIEEAVTLVFPRRTYTFPALTDAGPIYIGELFFRIEYVVMAVVAGAVMLGLWGLLHRTRFGLQLRAVSQNPAAARFSGINIPAVTFQAFLVAAVIGAIAGFLIAGTDQQITPKFGLWATIKGLIAMMLGGLGSIPGAILGGLLLGVVEVQSQWYLGTEYRDLVAYLLLFAVLALRPGGLMGTVVVTQEREAARRL
jgi:branched-chain amino acid transport system permease protein